MKKILKRLAAGFLAFATIVTALPTTAVHASEKQYWTESAERVGIVEKVMNDGSIGSTFNEGHMTVVDFPHPDGPTKTMNSRSFMSKLKSVTEY